MGGIATKQQRDNNDILVNLTDSPLPISHLLPKEKNEDNSTFPLNKTTVCASDADPRSPSCRRTPIHSPYSTPPFRGQRDKMRMRLADKLLNQGKDPRSPLVNRTPVSQITKTPSNMSNLVDPRSPFLTRTPVPPATPTTPAPNYTEEIVVAEEIIHKSDSGVFIEDCIQIAQVEKDSLLVMDSFEICAALKREDSTSSVATESTAEKVTTETFSSPETSPFPICAPSSPSGRKRKTEIAGNRSPLKRSFSAPINENDPPSPNMKSQPTSNRHSSKLQRAPLSPLIQRSSNLRFNPTMDMQPIELRIDPGVLG